MVQYRKRLRLRDRGSFQFLGASSVKVYVDPIPDTLSLAMHRVAKALKDHAPSGVVITKKPEQADIQFLHVIAPDSLGALKAPRYAIIQYCLNTAAGQLEFWQKPWSDSELVWSYYNLVPHITSSSHVEFLHLPLGIDENFTRRRMMSIVRDIGVMTSGYVAGPGAEAIEEVAIAASLAGMTTLHIGPHPQNMGIPPRGWSFEYGVTDTNLANYYSRSYWVSGLRHIEGFELPVIEGLSCGARPIVFDRPETRKWFRDHAIFVKEQSGNGLIADLLDIFRMPPQPVYFEEQLDVREKFSWANIAPQVWNAVLSTKEASV
jgi:hypothetical protein